MTYATDADSLSIILQDATEAIGRSYFQLYIDGGAPIYRERVYCYELYHQMRCRWPSDYPYMLNGEVDKRAHPILSRIDPALSTPDFLVHTPGDMAGNNTIIEVKHALSPAVGIRKDLRTLDRFVRSYGYRRAIYLVYGNEVDCFVPQARTSYFQLGARTPVELWLHSESGTAAVHSETLSPL